MILWHVTVCSLVCQYEHFRNLLPSSSKVCSFKMLVPTYHTAQYRQPEDHSRNRLVSLHKHQSVCFIMCIAVVCTHTHTHSCVITYVLWCCSVSSGHSRAGGVQRNAGAVHALRWRFPPCVCCHWQGKLWWDVQVPPTDPSGEGSGWVPHAHGRQQSWSGTPAVGECLELLESVFLHVYWVICWCQTVMTLVDNFLSLFCWHKQSSKKLYLYVICCIEFSRWRDDLQTEICYHIICVWRYEKCMENCGWKLKERDYLGDLHIDG